MPSKNQIFILEDAFRGQSVQDKEEVVYEFSETLNGGECKEVVGEEDCVVFMDADRAVKGPDAAGASRVGRWKPR